jgi:hypothetical protein
MRSVRMTCHHLLVAAVLVGMLALASCFEVPLGDPAKSRVDDRLLGYWQTTEMGDDPQVVKIARWDEHTYGILFQGYQEAGDQVVPGRAYVYKAWLTPVAGETFITLQPLDALNMGAQQQQQPVFLVARLMVEEDQLTAVGLLPNADAFKGVKDSAALAKAIEANLRNDEVYEEQKRTFRRMNVNGEREQAILKAFQ